MRDFMKENYREFTCYSARTRAIEVLRLNFYFSEI